MCPICSEIKSNTIGRPRINTKASQIIRKDYFVVRCESCGFYYVSPELKLTKTEWQKLYDSEYFEPMTRWYTKKRNRDRKKRFDKLNKYVEIKIKKFLDVGCGEGFSLIEATLRGWEAYGIDITDNRIAEAKISTINFKQSDLISAGFPENFFDCVYVDSVLEHVLNPMEYLKEIERITSAGGVIYIGVPNEDSLFNIVLKILLNFTGRMGESSRLKPFATPFHVGGFTNSSLRLAIRKSGLSIKKIRNFASKSDITNFKFLSRGFIILAFFLPFTFIAVPLRMEIYFEAYLIK